MSRYLFVAVRRGLAALAAVLVSVLLIGTGAAQAQACPNVSLSGQGLSGDANSFWTPQGFNVTAGGNVNLSTCGGIPGNGWVVSAPDFELSYNALNMGRDLEFRVTGNCDTVLLVNDSRGQWHFNDDADGTTHPRLRLANAGSGTYDIWVGTFGQSTCGATLTVETFGGFTQQPQPPVIQPQPPVVQPPVFSGVLPAPFSRVVFPDPGTLTVWRGRNGQIASFAVTGSLNGTIWGTDIYTDDSSLAVAAVHAGLLLPGQTGIVTVVIRPGQNAYAGSPRNGAQSQNFGSWNGSYSFLFP